MSHLVTLKPVNVNPYNIGKAAVPIQGKYTVIQEPALLKLIRGIKDAKVKKFELDEALFLKHFTAAQLDYFKKVFKDPSIGITLVPVKTTSPDASVSQKKAEADLLTPSPASKTLKEKQSDARVQQVAEDVCKSSLRCLQGSMKGVNLRKEESGLELGRQEALKNKAKEPEKGQKTAEPEPKKSGCLRCLGAFWQKIKGWIDDICEYFTKSKAKAKAQEEKIAAEKATRRMGADQALLKACQDGANVYSTAKTRAELLIQEARETGDYYKNIGRMFAELQTEFFANLVKNGIATDKNKSTFNNAVLSAIVQEYYNDPNRPSIVDFIKEWDLDSIQVMLGILQKTAEKAVWNAGLARMEEDEKGNQRVKDLVAEREKVIAKEDALKDSVIQSPWKSLFSNRTLDYVQTLTRDSEIDIGIAKEASACKKRDKQSKKLVEDHKALKKEIEALKRAASFFELVKTNAKFLVEGKVITLQPTVESLVKFIQLKEILPMDLERQEISGPSMQPSAFTVFENEPAKVSKDRKPIQDILPADFDFEFRSVSELQKTSN